MLTQENGCLSQPMKNYYWLAMLLLSVGGRCQPAKKERVDWNLRRNIHNKTQWARLQYAQNMIQYYLILYIAIEEFCLLFNIESKPYNISSSNVYVFVNIINNNNND